jgi:hypothetical protein
MLETIKKRLPLESRILILAVVVSLFWHLLWLSLIKVVVKPDRIGPIKFSKVAFLGPVSAAGTGELSVAPRTLSFLEKRYRNNVMRSSAQGAAASQRSAGYAYTEEKAGTQAHRDDGITYLIQDALESPKPQPPIAAD